MDLIGVAKTTANEQLISARIGLTSLHFSSLDRVVQEKMAMIMTIYTIIYTCKVRLEAG